MSIKSTTIRPPKFLNLSCLATSCAASIFVASAVSSTFFPWIDLPELTSIETNASVGLITKYPPDFNGAIGFNNCSSFLSMPNFLKIDILSL